MDANTSPIGKSLYNNRFHTAATPSIVHGFGLLAATVKD